MGRQRLLFHFAVPFILCGLSPRCLLVECQAPGPVEEKCDQTGLNAFQRFCRCKTSPEYVVFDFSSLTLDGNRWYNATGGSEQYFMNPCQITTMHTGTGSNGISNFCGQHSPEASAGICQLTKRADGNYYFSLGQLQTVAGYRRNDGVIFTLQHGNVGRQSSLLYKCDPSVEKGKERLEFLEENPTLTYKLQMRTRLACEHIIDPTRHPHHQHGAGHGTALGVGWVVVIVILSAAVLYFPLGMLYNSRVRMLRGTEAVPHYIFWTQLPSLVKDGARFIASGCKATQTYETL